MKFALINSAYKRGSTGKSVEKNSKRLRNLGHNVKVYYGMYRNSNDDPDAICFGNHILIKKQQCKLML